MSFRYGSGIVKPGFNPLGAQTSVTYYDIYSWGFNTQGQLGDNTSVGRSSPVQVGSPLNTWSQTTIAAGLRHNLALKTDASLWSWGRNAAGELGIGGDLTNKSSPVQIGSFGPAWNKIATSAFGSFAIKTDGSMWVWGVGAGGVQGSGNTYDLNSPNQIGALTTWSKVAGGNFHGMAIKTDGTLWMWGDNSYGQLGQNNTTYRSSPVQVGALTTWLEVAGGGYSTYAIKTDGTLWAWGRGQVGGMLGLNSTTDRSSPVQIGADTNWSSVNGGSEFAVALKTTGTLWAWGRNDFFGMLGDGTKISRSSPVQIGSLTTWSKAEAGRTHSLALKTDGTLWSWGYNDVGELGLNDRVDRSSPVQIGSFTDWLGLSAGGYHNVAIR